MISMIYIIVITRQLKFTHLYEIFVTLFLYFDHPVGLL